MPKSSETKQPWSTVLTRVKAWHGAPSRCASRVPAGCGSGADAGLSTVQGSLATHPSFPTSWHFQLGVLHAGFCPYHTSEAGELRRPKAVWINCQNKMLPVTAARVGRGARADGCWCLSFRLTCLFPLDLSSISDEKSIKHLPNGCVCYTNITDVKWGRNPELGIQGYPGELSMF